MVNKALNFNVFLFACMDVFYRLHLFFSSFLYHIWVSEDFTQKSAGKVMEKVEDGRLILSEITRKWTLKIGKNDSE